MKDLMHLHKQTFRTEFTEIFNAIIKSTSHMVIVAIYLSYIIAKPFERYSIECNGFTLSYFRHSVFFSFRSNNLVYYAIGTCTSRYINKSVLVSLGFFLQRSSFLVIFFFSLVSFKSTPTL